MKLQIVNLSPCSEYGGLFARHHIWDESYIARDSIWKRQYQLLSEFNETKLSSGAVVHRCMGKQPPLGFALFSCWPWTMAVIVADEEGKPQLQLDLSSPIS